MCKNYVQNQFCKFGKQCSFAHGKEELRLKDQLNLSYKTKICKNFELEGYCGFG